MDSKSSEKKLDKNLICLYKFSRKLLEKSLDYDWNGETEKAKIYSKRYEEVKKRIESGELYEPKF